MNVISHRGNLNGIDEKLENHPQQIQFCIDEGYDVEVDLRMKDEKPYLGHDFAEHEISVKWIDERKSHLWIHVKEFSALTWLMKNVPNSRYFCHESDRYTLVSSGHVWCHDTSNIMNNNCIIPLLTHADVENYDFKSQKDLFAVCTDFVYNCEKRWNDESKS